MITLLVQPYPSSFRQVKINKRQNFAPIHRIGLIYLAMSLVMLCAGLSYAIHVVYDRNEYAEIANNQAISAIKLGDEVLNQRIPVQHALATIKSHAILFQHSLELLVSDPHYEDHKLYQIEDFITQDNEHIKRLDTSLIDIEHRQQMFEGIAVLMDIVDEVSSAKGANERVEIYWDSKQTLAHNIELIDEIDRIISSQNEQRRDQLTRLTDEANFTLEDNNNTHDKPIVVLIIVIIMALIIPFAFAVSFYKRLAYRMNKLDDYAMNIGQENYSLPPFKANDSTGALGLRLNLLGRQVRHLLEQSRISTQHAEGEKKKAEHLAWYDGLTGLTNRRHFIDLLEKVLTTWRPTSTPFFLLFLDLDNFKIINDTEGHDAGDLLLKTLAKRIELAVRPGDIVARLGGDEFAALVSCEETYIKRIATRILSDVAQPLELCKKQIDVSVSIGITKFNEQNANVTVLLKQADNAMYLSKKQGKNKFCFFNNALAAMLHEKDRLREELDEAYKEDQFELYYQPKYRFSDKQICGCEALLRWNHPSQGVMNAGQFIEALEQHPKILDIDNWVISEGCRNVMEMHKRGLEIPIAINISARQFSDPGFVARISEVLIQTGLPAQMLELEITENMIVNDMRKAAAILTQLRSIGVRIAIDDFGTGYSSLSYLMNLPLDTLKIDRSFVINLTDKKGSSIVEAIVTLGKRLNLQIVAEGIETEEQFELLKNSDCDIAQGFLLSRPIPLNDICALSAKPEQASPAAKQSWTQIIQPS